MFRFKIGLSSLSINSSHSLLEVSPLKILKLYEGLLTIDKISPELTFETIIDPFFPSRRFLLNFCNSLSIVKTKFFPGYAGILLLFKFSISLP